MAGAKRKTGSASYLQSYASQKTNQSTERIPVHRWAGEEEGKPSTPSDYFAVREADAEKELEEQGPSCAWRPEQYHKSPQQLWETVRSEATADSLAEPALASFLYSTILGHSSLEQSICFLLANKLASSTLLSTQLMELFTNVLKSEPGLAEDMLCDMLAVFDRDPACDKYCQCLLYFKGFHAIQAHRIAHWLWTHGRKTLAMALQSRISDIFHVDIHPGARIGRGVMFDHATGIVIGETAVIGDNCSILHHVTLGGSGTGTGDRHPKIGNGVLIGAGVVVLGNVKVGDGSKIGAGSVVLTSVPPHSTAVGVPVRLLKRKDTSPTDPFVDPALEMDQISFIEDWSDYII